MTESPPCTIPILPAHLVDDAARVAAEVFPANRPAVQQGIWIDLVNTYKARYDKWTDSRDYGPTARPSRHLPRERDPMGNLTILHGVRTVQLTQGYNTLMDEADYLRVSAYSWSVLKSRNIRYAFRGAKGSHLLMHKLILGTPRGGYGDHRNSDGLDNRRSNLRACTSSQNAQNRRVFLGVSRFKGVTYCGPACKTKPWRARIRGLDQRRMTLGRFATEVEAAKAYDAKARELYGEFAATNEDVLGGYPDA